MKESTLPKVMIGAPIQRNRAWILPEYLSHLYNLDYPKDKIHLSFLINGKRQDNTSCLIEEFRVKFEDVYDDIDIWYMNDEHMDDRVSQRDYGHFANIRNTWLTMREDDEYIFSVDSDVLIGRDCLLRLINHRKDIVSALVCNGRYGFFDFYNILNLASYGKDENYYEHVTKTDGLISIDVTGACYLINRKVLDAGVCYGPHSQGEDIYWCERAKEHGFSIFCDQDLPVEHIMEKEE